MKNLLSLRCRKFLCPVMAVIITFSPMVSFGAWAITNHPMAVTQMQNVVTDGNATGAGQLRTVTFRTKHPTGAFNPEEGSVRSYIRQQRHAHDAHVHLDYPDSTQCAMEPESANDGLANPGPLHLCPRFLR